MWCPLFLLLIVSAASAEHWRAWKTDTEYQYAVRGRTLAALHDVSHQYTGIILRALLTVQPKSKDTLEARISNAQYAQIHTKLPDGWKSKIPESMLDLKQLPMTEKVFEVKMQGGVVRDLIVDKDVPTWEVNMIKSIVSQLQVDTQAENLMPSRYNQAPEDNRVNAMFKTMEDSVGGKCEVLYDISPLPEHLRSMDSQDSSWKDPDNGEPIEIVKTKNYTNCEQRVGHHFGGDEPSAWEQLTSGNGEFMSRSSISRVVVRGDLNAFTIYSAVTVDSVLLSPNFYDSQKGMVSSRVNVTLLKMGPVSSGAWSTPVNPESTGNLVYSYNNPFAKPDEERRAGQWSDSGPQQWNKNDHSAEKSREDNDSSASDASRDIDSLESNERRKSMWQSKPTLNEAPNTPLLPLSIGYHGKSIQKSADFDPCSTATRLAGEIGRDLQNPNTIMDEQTLEKFIILARLIRTMSTQQIAEAERDVYQSANEIDPHDESQSVRRNTWVAFRNAVAEAGTGPALVTIKNWIKEKKIKGTEAASVVAELSRSARTPTPEYMNAFFEMATMPETTCQEFLNSSAIITFARLVRLSQVNHQSAHDRYPVYTYGRLSPKHNPAIFSDYVPYIAEQIEKAIENEEAAKSHVYIRALAEVAHPKILAVLEPYLEGKKQASTTQRMMMVWAMDKLAALRPRLASGVLYRIYQNTAEAHQVRCAAVTLLVATDPPANMLQRMAEFTNYDHSKQVNAAVKTAIESASKLKMPEAQDLVKKARNARPLLNKETYGYEYSKNYFMDHIAKDINIAYRSWYTDVGSDDSFIPQAVSIGSQMYLGGLAAPEMEFGAMVSSVKDLYRALWRELIDDEDSKNEQRTENELSPEKIAELLNIVSEDREHLEGAWLINTRFMNGFYAFDKHTLKHLPELLSKAFASLKNGHNSNIAKFVNNEISLSFPMESGLPFVFTFNAPIMVKYSSSIKGQNNPGSIEGSSDIRIIWAISTQSQLGFVTPFEHQHYLAGVSKNFQMHLPIQAKISYEKSENRATLKLQPIDKSQEIKVLQFSIMPFTSRHDILSMSPVTKDKETHECKNSYGEWENESIMNLGSSGMKLKFERAKNTKDPFASESSDWTEDPIAALGYAFMQKKIELRRTVITLVPDSSAPQSIMLSASFETLEDTTTKQAPKRNEKDLIAKAPKVLSKEINDPKRMKQLLKDAAEGIAAAEAMAVDFSVELPGPIPSHLIVTLAYADSKIDEKSRGLLYIGSNIHGNLGETCTSIEAQSPTVSVFDMEMANKSPSKPSRHMDWVIRTGETCEDGMKLHIRAKQEQSQKWRDSLKELPSTMKCMKDVERGMKSSSACQDMGDKLALMDEAEFQVKFEPDDLYMKETVDGTLGMLSNFIDGAYKNTLPTDGNEDSLNFTMNMYPSNDRADFSYQSSNSVIYIRDVDISSLATLIGNADPELTISQSLNMEMSEKNSRQDICIIDTKTARSFDQNSYPIDLGKCWHVAVTTYPKSQKNGGAKEPIPEDMRLNVLVRDAEDNMKEVKIALGDSELMLMNSAGKNQASLDGKILDLEENPCHREKDKENKEETEIEVVRRRDGSIKVTSDKYEVDLIYYGDRIQIQASDKYKRDVRGLCGNYDSQPSNDFTSPRNCILTKADQFAASYALTSKDCQGQALEMSKKAEQAECHHNYVRPGNVVNDREAGREKRGKSSWGKKDDSNEHQSEHKRCTTVRTKVIEDGDQMCFSLRPLPECTPSCNPSRTKPKHMPMYCMPKGPEASTMANNIKDGANPDLSQKEMSKKMEFFIPVSCHAA